MTQRQNYIARIEANKQSRLAAGLVSDVYPGVSEIVIIMTYYQKALNNVLMVRTMNILPTGNAYFNMECMSKDCSNGGFDLTPVVTRMVKGRKKSLKGTMACKGNGTALAADHASISYEIVIKYKKTS